MKFAAALSVLAVAGSALASAVPAVEKRDTSECVGSLLCCGTLTTPLDQTLDPILLDLGIDAASIVGSIGLLCHTYDDTCDTEPQCCTEANVLNGVLALGCSPLEHH
ncbi:hypothetical protein BDW69DRAFT_167070 [Aspergillus filifer]